MRANNISADQCDLQLNIVLRQLEPLGIKGTPERIRSNYRGANDVFLRACVCVMLKESGLSLARIGRIINRDHTTVMHLLNNYKNRNQCRDDRWEKVCDFASEYYKNCFIQKRIEYHQKEIKRLQKMMQP